MCWNHLFWSSESDIKLFGNGIQSGFKTNYNNTSATLTVLNYISSAMNTKLHCAANSNDIFQRFQLYESY